MKAPFPQPISIHRKPERGHPVEENIACEPAPASYPPLVGGPVVKADLIFDHHYRCARRSGQAAAPPSRVMKSRRFTAIPPVLRVSGRKDSTAGDLLRCGISSRSMSYSIASSEAQRKFIREWLWPDRSKYSSRRLG